MKNISEEGEDKSGPLKSNSSPLSDRLLATTDKVKEKISDFDTDGAMDAILAAPRRLKKELRKMTFFSSLTRFPAPTVAICILFTMFFLFHSGILDKWTGTASINVNGDLEVYLPDDSRVKDDISTIEEDWTTNAMIIYVESENQAVTNVEILKQFDLIERQLNKVVSDGGDEDGIIYILSISTVVKEVNSSAPRVAKAFFSNAFDENLSQQINNQIDDLGDTLGGYSIPDDQNRVNQIIGELPPNAKDKLYRDVGSGALETLGYPNRGVIVVGVVDSGFVATEIPEVCKTGGQRQSEAYTDIITYTECWIEQTSLENNWNKDTSDCQDTNDGQNTTGPECLGLTMTLTGPVPITNSVTKYSFVLFWQIFPLAIVAVAFGLFLFHSDLIQTGRVRVIQGIKVIIISGLPTLCSVWWTLGIIGYLDYEVTMTVIIVGPILLALGVSYGLHITNRYAEESGTPEDKMAIALQSTGKAVLLSAITTVIGFISLVSTPMAPIKTVGIALAGGIVIVYMLTMVMVPNLTMLLDLKKPSHPPPKIIEFIVEKPISWPKITLSFFIILMLISSVWARPLVEENIDLLDMAPEGQPPILKMKQYSDEFNAGQIGMLLVDGAISGDRDDDTTENDDPFSKLQDIETLENKSDSVDKTNAVSIVFLMKSVGVSVSVSGELFLPFCDIAGGTAGEVCYVIFDREQEQDATFWKVLNTFNTDDDGNKRVQIFLLDVFYASLTQETRQLFINDTFQRSLIYIDMPFMNVQDTQEAVDEVNKAAERNYPGGITSSPLIGVAAVTIAVNELIVGSQWTSLGFALIATLFTLAIVFRDPKYAFLTTLPVVFTVAMQWLVMQQMEVTLSLVTVMIGSILVGVGIDFSIHIANRVREQGGTIEAVREACTTTGMSLIEAVVVTCAGLATAFFIPIPALKPFVKVIIILLIVAASSALLLLPAIFTFLIQSGVGLVGGSATMIRTAKLIAKGEDEEVVLASSTHRIDHDSW
ncbi:MAG: hypothetical protein CMO20_06365 [Thermoplasmata archaeon]|mgnify:CR=1 FL=1|nr:hypothetical protein [Thermoplasmata archaeon]